MKWKLTVNPIAYIFIGLMGLVLVNIKTRNDPFSWLKNDLFLGVFYGVFMGMQLLGVYLLMVKKNKKPI